MHKDCVCQGDSHPCIPRVRRQYSLPRGLSALHHVAAVDENALFPARLGHTVEEKLHEPSPVIQYIDDDWN